MRVPGINAVFPAQLVATIDGDPSPSSIVVADDRRDATSALDLPATTAPLVVVCTNGRGPAAARNADWRAGGFDERFPRGFRDDADLGLRTARVGYAVVWGERVTTHPLASSGNWRSGLKDQAGNAGNALLRAKHERRWRSLIGTSPGRTSRPLITTAAATAAIAATSSSRLAGPLARANWIGVAAAADRVWTGLTEFALSRIVSRPRTRAQRAIGRATPHRKITMNRAGDGGLRRVLVARLDSLGDVLLARPAVRAVTAHARVTLLVRTDSTKRPGCYRRMMRKGALWL